MELHPLEAELPLKVISFAFLMSEFIVNSAILNRALVLLGLLDKALTK